MTTKSPESVVPAAASAGNRSTSTPTASSKSASSNATLPSLGTPVSVSQTPVSTTVQCPPSNDISNQLKPFTADALMNGMATLVGALVGAMLAYWFQRKLQRTQELKVELSSAHRLMFVLLHQANTIVLIQKDFVFTELKNPARFLSIPAAPPFDTKKNVLELPELAFLLSSNEGRAILYDFYMAQENYLETLTQWNHRSALHLEKVQPLLAASGVPMGTVVTEADLKRILGEHVYGAIVNSTDNCIKQLKRSFNRTTLVKEKALPYLEKRFKTKNFTNFDYPETFGLTEAAHVA